MVWYFEYGVKKVRATTSSSILTVFSFPSSTASRALAIASKIKQNLIGGCLAPRHVPLVRHVLLSNWCLNLFIGRILSPSRPWIQLGCILKENPEWGIILQSVYLSDILVFRSPKKKISYIWYAIKCGNSNWHRWQCIHGSLTVNIWLAILQPTTAPITRSVPESQAAQAQSVGDVVRDLHW